MLTSVKPVKMAGRKRRAEGMKGKLTSGKPRIAAGRFKIAVALLCLALPSGCGKKVWEKQITEEDIVIEGLTGEYDLLFLTDNHMIVMDEKDSEQIAQNAASRFTMFQNEEGVSSAEQFGEWVSYANEEEMDGVLLGGDIIDYPSEANIAFLKEQLERFRMPYLYVLGNHDWTYPWEYMTEYGKTAYRPLFEPYMKGNSAFQVQDFGEFLVVAVDNSGNQIDGEALEEYEEVLEEGRPVIVMVHVPFYAGDLLEKAKTVWNSPVVIGAGAQGGIYPNETSLKFMELTTAEDSPVQAVIAGHVHFYHKGYIEGEKKVLQIVGNAGAYGSAVRLHVHGKS